MLLNMLKGKIHRAVVTQAELDYVGSITIDERLMEEACIHEYEQVQVVDVNNGLRLETYAITGKRDSGVICLNGAAARLRVILTGKGIAGCFTMRGGRFVVTACFCGPAGVCGAPGVTGKRPCLGKRGKLRVEHSGGIYAKGFQTGRP